MALTIGYARMTMGSLFEKGLLFGLYLATFVHALRWLIFNDEGWKMRKLNPIMLIATFLVLASTLVSFVGDMVMTFLALHIADTRFSHTGVSLMFCVLGRGTIFIVIDAVLIYRCWVILFKKWYIICLPVALWITCLINCVIANYCYWRAVFLNIQKPFPKFCNQPAMALIFFSTNVAIGVYTTSAIIYQILVSTKYSKDKRRLYNICRILTESGILYTISGTIYLITVMKVANLRSVDTTLVAYSVAQSLTLPLVLYLPGIAFNLITIRTGQQRASSVDPWTPSLDTTSNTSELPNYSSPAVIHKEVYVEHARTDAEEILDIGKMDIDKTDSEKTDVGRTDSEKTDVGRTDSERTDVENRDPGEIDVEQQ
ncbi:hypothetical protein M378DRAFT_13495 [Amanita muscaria Koide BX008]|uniref:Uncharacterized protein n=1 Tax=Amanita muscaria (strain Koide BX008) TaxID=946122 RepID=A0A0C2SEG8_AMAMK|nr:hypothetical protein M378DRAFT_13495 [Amanita muscaria Koide BX008]